MIESTHLRRGRRCIFLLHVHLVFVTKYRKKVFRQRHLKHLKSTFKELCHDFDAELIEFDGEGDHVHLLVNYPPKTSVTKMVNSLKGVSSRLLKKEYPEISPYYWKGALWSPSYFAGACGGAPLEIIKKYIEEQASPKS